MSTISITTPLEGCTLTSLRTMEDVGALIRRRTRIQRFYVHEITYEKRAFPWRCMGSHAKLMEGERENE